MDFSWHEVQKPLLVGLIFLGIIAAEWIRRRHVRRNKELGEILRRPTDNSVKPESSNA